MKKRFAGFLLACVVAAGMLPGALAAAPEMRQLWQAEYMWESWDSKAEYMESQGYSEEAYQLFEQAMQEKFREFENDPEYWKQLGYDDYTLFVQDFWDDEPDRMDAEDALNLKWEAAYWAAYEQVQGQLWRSTYGVPYLTGINMQLDGEYLTFPDARPEYRDGRVMAPLRAVAEALGMQVGYQDGTVTAQGAEVSLAFRAGDTALQKTENGKTGPVDMETAPYEKDGRMYVPVRGFAEALGLTVEWSEPCEAVILFDRAALIAGIDQDFTIVNRVFGADNGLNPEETIRTALDIAGELTLFDSLDGDQTYPMEVHVVSEQQGADAHVSVRIDVMKIVDMMLKDAEEDLRYMEEGQRNELIEIIRSALQKGDLELIVNADEGAAYFKSAMVAEFLKAYSPLLVRSVDGGKVWFRMSLEPLTGIQTVPEITVEPVNSFGGMLYAAVYGSSEKTTLVRTLKEQGALWKEAFGDAAFQTKGTTHTIRFDVNLPKRDWFTPAPQDLNAMESALYGAGVRTLTGTLTVRDNGSFSCGLTTRMERYGVMVSELTVKADSSGGHMNADVTAHTRNAFKLAMHIAADTRNIGAGLPATPPEGELVIDLTSLLEDYSKQHELPAETLEESAEEAGESPAAQREQPAADAA